METSLEDGFHLAVPDDVLGLLNSLFLAGLTIFIYIPLIRDYSWNTGANISSLRVRPLRCNLLTPLEVAMLYLATISIAGDTFMFTSFWIYHYVGLEYEFKDMNELDTVAAQSSQEAFRGL